MLLVRYFSVSGHAKTPYFALKMYNASKYAVTILCDGLRHELQLIGSKIKVSVKYKTIKRLYNIL